MVLSTIKTKAKVYPVQIPNKVCIVNKLTNTELVLQFTINAWYEFVVAPEAG